MRNLFATFGIAMGIEDIKLLIKKNKLPEALVALDDILGGKPDEAEAYFERGKVYWRMGNRAAAISDYCRAVAIDPHSPAAIALEQARSIEDFFNPDLLNP